MDTCYIPNNPSLCTTWANSNTFPKCSDSPLVAPIDPINSSIDSFPRLSPSYEEDKILESRRAISPPPVSCNDLVQGSCIFQSESNEFLNCTIASPAQSSLSNLIPLTPLGNITPSSNSTAFSSSLQAPVGLANSNVELNHKEKSYLKPQSDNSAHSHFVSFPTRLSSK